MEIEAIWIRRCRQLGALAGAADVLQRPIRATGPDHERDAIAFGRQSFPGHTRPASAAMLPRRSWSMLSPQPNKAPVKEPPGNKPPAEKDPPSKEPPVKEPKQ
jgi:hypothetical protein